MDRSLKPHDANQLQLKLGYTMAPSVARQRFSLEWFMFVPRSLGVGGRSYEAHQFYEDMQSFVRLKSPRVALAALGTAEGGKQWYEPLEAAFAPLLAGTAPPDLTELLRQVKVLGSVFHAAIRDETVQLLCEFDKSRVPPQADELAARVGEYVDALGAALRQLWRVGASAVHGIVPPEVQVTWAAVDEHVALYAEEKCTRLALACDGWLAHPRAGAVLGPARERAARMAVELRRYRVSQGYPSVVHPGESNDTLLRRRRILKRVVHSALSVDIHLEEGGVTQRDFIAGIAAAGAMALAAAVDIWVHSRLSAVSSVFVLVVALSYMLKDRLKEWGKRFLGRRFARWMPDRVVQVRDPHSHEVVGKATETVSIIEAQRVAPEVVRLRHCDHPTLAAETGRNELVIRYVKHVVLSSAGLRKAHTGVEGLSETIRFNFARFRERMEPALELYRIVDPDTLRIVEVPCARVYHINLVLRFGSTTEALVTERVRVILDQSGIRAVERVESYDSGRRDQVSGEPLAPQLHAATVFMADDEDEPELLLSTDSSVSSLARHT